jgi:hypothetical protein
VGSLLLLGAVTSLVHVTVKRTQSSVGSALAPPSTKSSRIFAKLKKSLLFVFRSLSNHFSLFVPLAQWSRFDELIETSGFVVRSAASGGSVGVADVQPLACLAATSAHFTANTELYVVILLLPVLTIATGAIVSVTTRRNTFPVAFAVVLQLFYMTVVSRATTVLQYDTFSFYSIETFFAPVVAARSVPEVTLRPMHSDRSVELAGNVVAIAVGISTLLIIGVGVPLAFVLIRKHSAFGPERTAEIFLFLTDKYHADCWYWESVIALRKALLQTAMALFFNLPTLQLYTYTVLLLLYVFLLDKMKPTSSTIGSLLEHLSCLSAIVTAMGFMFSAELQNLQSMAVAIIVAFVQAAAVVAILVGGWLNAEDENNSSQQQAFPNPNPNLAGSSPEDSDEKEAVEDARTSAAEEPLAAGSLLPTEMQVVELRSRRAWVLVENE